MPPPANPKDRTSIKNQGKAPPNANVVTANTALQVQARTDLVAKARQGDASQALTATGNPLPPKPPAKAAANPKVSLSAVSASSAASASSASAGPFQTASKSGANRPPGAPANVPRIVPQVQLPLKGKGKGGGLSIQDLVQTVSSEEEDPRRGNRRRSQ